MEYQLHQNARNSKFLNSSLMITHVWRLAFLVLDRNPPASNFPLFESQKCKMFYSNTQLYEHVHEHKHEHEHAHEPEHEHEHEHEHEQAWGHSRARGQRGIDLMRLLLHRALHWPACQVNCNNALGKAQFAQFSLHTIFASLHILSILHPIAHA